MIIFSNYIHLYTFYALFLDIPFPNIFESFNSSLYKINQYITFDSNFKYSYIQVISSIPIINNVITVSAYTLSHCKLAKVTQGS